MRTLLLQRPGLTMILHETRRFTAPVIAIYDGSAESHKVLNAAGSLVETKDIPLEVIILADDLSSAQKLESEVTEKVRGKGLMTDLRRLINPSLKRLIMAVQRKSISPVVIPCGERDVLQGEALCSIINEINNPVLVVR